MLDIAGQVAAGVAHLHARGIVHGGAHTDVGPAAQPAVLMQGSTSSILHGQAFVGPLLN